MFIFVTSYISDQLWGDEVTFIDVFLPVVGFSELLKNFIN